MEEIITFANKLGGVSFATLLVIILAGSYFKKWTWYYYLESSEKEKQDQKESYEKRIAALETSNEKWQQVALSATGISETATQILKSKAA